MPLTPADVRNKQFSTTRLRPGYDEEEVDAFLDEVEAELDRLIQENEELRTKLAECLRGKVPGGVAAPASGQAPPATAQSPHAPAAVAQPPAAVAPAGVGAPSSAPVDTTADHMKPPEPPKSAEPAVPAEMGMPNVQQGEDNMDTAARVLALAQQTADQAIADARREADETVTRARREADDVLTKARRQAEQIIGDARSRAEALERDAQERHRQAMGSLVQTRDELERKVEELRGFEREYRTRLKAYLETQLRELEAGASDSGGFPMVGGPPVAGGPGGLPHPEARNGQQSVPAGAGGAPGYGTDGPGQHPGGFPGGEASPDRR